LYTGDASAPDSEYNAAAEAAGASVTESYNSAVAEGGAITFDNTPGTRSMLQHYMSGNGEPYNLSDSQMSDVASGAMDAIRSGIEQQLINNPNSNSGTFPLRTSFRKTPGLFPLGGTKLKIEFDCTPGGGCRVKVIVNDEFVDALDIPNWLPGDQDMPGGTPYPIGGETILCL